MRRSRLQSWRFHTVLAVACLVMAAAPARADEGWSAWSGGGVEQGDIGDPDLAPDGFGLTANMDFISAEEFVCSDPANNCDYARCDTANYWCSDSQYVDVFAAVEIPAGALITGMRVLYYDNSPSLYLAVRLQLGWTSLGVRGDSQLASWTSAGTPQGVDDVYVDVSPDVTVERRYPVLTQWGYRSYYLYVSLPPTLNVQLRGVAVFWNRQISPAPASPTFADVPVGHWAFQHVEALVASGITAGCGGGDYCPDATLTRGQMAVFLAKGLGLHYPY